MQKYAGSGPLGAIESWGVYHPTRVCGVSNPLHDDISRMVIGMKNLNQAYIRFFAEQLDNWIPGGVIICTAPSSNPETVHNGISQVGRLLAARRDRVDGTHVLKRKTDTSGVPLAARTFKTHFDSIEVTDPGLVRGRAVVVLDDVTTREHTLRACGTHLMVAAAQEVMLRALVRTVFYRDYFKPAKGVS